MKHPRIVRPVRRRPARWGLAVVSVFGALGCASSASSERPARERPAVSPREGALPRTPPPRGRRLMRAYLTRDHVAGATRDDRLALVITVGSGDELPRADLGRAAVVAAQRRRLTAFRRQLLHEGPSEQLRKRFVCWLQCECTFVTRCQGGREPCVCAACESLAGSDHPGTRRWHGWPALRWLDPRAGGATDRLAACPSKNVCLLVDVSGSMKSEDKLERVKAAAVESLGYLMPGDVFSLVAFSDRPHLVVPPTHVEADLARVLWGGGSRAGSPGRVARTLEARIAGLEAGGRTDIRGALHLAADVLERTDEQRALLRDPGSTNRILLFSDGMHEDRKATDRVLEEFSDVVRGIAERNISISSFGVGSVGFDEDLLTALVRPDLGHSGSYFYVRDTGALGELLWHDVMLQPVAAKARLEVEAASGVEVLPVSSKVQPAAGEPRRVTANLKRVAWGQLRAVVLELRAAPGSEGQSPLAWPTGRSPGERGGEPVRLAEARLTYLDSQGVAREEVLAVEAGREPAGGAPTIESVLALQQVLVEETRQTLRDVVDSLDEGDARAGAAALREQESRLNRLSAVPPAPDRPVEADDAGASPSLRSELPLEPTPALRPSRATPSDSPRAGSGGGDDP